MSNAGRKSKYHTHVVPRFDEIKKWLKRGATDKEIIKLLGVGKSTFYEYLEKYPELSEFLKENRIDSVENIKCAIYNSAVGFDYEETETTTMAIEYPDYVKDLMEENGVNVTAVETPKLTKVKTTKKHALPNTTAGLILLKHWDKENGWTSDPQTLKLRREEFEHRKKQDEENNF